MWLLLGRPPDASVRIPGHSSLTALEEEASGLLSVGSAEPFGGSFTVTAPDTT
ncbi:hypothetical protein COMA1_50121 [Candidatus Nitrospira nitrosa]|uniref:Uncharacterized protein n=1 Tax=Candidatus Nitrospira nitrosa TaxID=1742972 RepID=A0A0S4LR78_9BACT|nr:hypothetical protein COMA1_50121 [Candidatus Nitrospira nitrosa]